MSHGYTMDVLVLVGVSLTESNVDRTSDKTSKPFLWLWLGCPKIGSYQCTFFYNCSLFTLGLTAELVWKKGGQSNTIPATLHTKVNQLFFPCLNSNSSIYKKLFLSRLDKLFFMLHFNIAKLKSSVCGDGQLYLLFFLKTQLSKPK